MDTMVTFSDHSLQNNFLTKEELKRKCPVAFLNSPTNPKVSGQYVLANTETIIDDMERLGWKPVDVRSRNSRKKGGIYSFHMVVFQNPDVSILGNDGNGGHTVDYYPRIIMTNSHDGFNAFKFYCGLFRCVCSNGLVIADDQMINMSIRHINYTFDGLRELISHALEELPKQICVMNEMRSVNLSKEQKYELAIDMMKIRRGVKDDESIELSERTIEDILNPVRTADKSDDLWTVFNVIQEKMVKGGFSAENKKGKSRKVRPIKSCIKDLEMNRKMFSRAKVCLDLLKTTCNRKESEKIENI